MPVSWGYGVASSRPEVRDRPMVRVGVSAGLAGPIGPELSEFPPAGELARLVDGGCAPLSAIGVLRRLRRPYRRM